MYFLNCFFAAPQPILGHCRGDSLTQPILITAIMRFRLEGQREPHDDAGSKSSAKRLVGFEPGTFQF